MEREELESILATLDPNAARYFDPLGHAPPPAPLPEHEQERARLRVVLVTTRQRLSQARRALQMVLADPVVRERAMKTLAPWWTMAQNVLNNRPEEGADEGQTQAAEGSERPAEDESQAGPAPTAGHASVQLP